MVWNITQTGERKNVKVSSPYVYFVVVCWHSLDDSLVLHWGICCLHRLEASHQSFTTLIFPSTSAILYFFFL